jgi:3-hydroxybutyryl-CoA dehydrogenase
VIRQVGLVGTGTMGRGIAQVFAQKGIQTILWDLVPSQLDRAMRSIENSLSRELSAARIDAKAYESALNKIRKAAELESLAEADLAIEAVSENYETKKKVLENLDKCCPQDVVLASNTSSISITQLASVTGRPDRVVGIHFMNPVPVMRLVEIVRGARTSQETIEIAKAVVSQLDKVSVEVKDSPGFVSNRVLLPMINEAIFCVYESVAGVEAVDQVMKLGMNHPMGPLKLADLIGLDVCLDIIETLYREFHDSKYRPCPLLTRKVAAGQLGRKSGEGFYLYPTETKRNSA